MAVLIVSFCLFLHLYSRDLAVIIIQGALLFLLKTLAALSSKLLVVAKVASMVTCLSCLHFYMDK